MRYDQLIHEFMKEAKHIDPEKYKEVCEQYPILTAEEQNRIREYEISLEYLENATDHE